MELLKILTCVDSLIVKAKEEIPKLPTETWKSENFYVSEAVSLDDKYYVMSLIISPPTKDESLICKKWMIKCEISFLSEHRALERPYVYDFADIILKDFEQPETRLKIVKEFENILLDSNF